MDPRATDKLIRRTAMVASCTAAYLLLTADYGPDYNALDPIKNTIKTMESSVKSYIFGASKGTQNDKKEEPGA